MLGSDEGCRGQLQRLLTTRLAEVGVELAAIRFISEEAASTRDARAPLVAIFFGAPAYTVDTPLVDDLIEDSITVVPLVSSLEQVHTEIPPQLRFINALEFGLSGEGIERVATLVLEAFRLLRRERRLFISYRRVDSQPFAERLYDALDARGFDVFIDVRSVPPAVDFQSELWHRMSDSDVVVLIDTPGFRESRWTTEELAKANATNIQILHLLWPGQEEDGASSFSHFMRLERRDFRLGLVMAQGRWVKQHTLARICDEAERLRARAIAARHRYLIDNFCDAAEDLGLDTVIQPYQWILVKTPGCSKSLVVVPAVGLPTSSRINEIFNSLENPAMNTRDVWIIYDNRGVLNSWLKHLDWLDMHLPIRTVRMAQAPEILSGFIS
ncbi:toll/interleukin-1 receptor domain-containing protein [Geomonas sp. Red32]|uniref:toll/interleukin-1 receptor domain-containing protein n=1 Tax=Geomonas sp. Red32 TaxID=2912856 RepID=UPI00202CFE4C|nr:toll/interleukin-1 receptor domain-containing protein [Geomonas sp. Red32]MCM0082364.1 toll/interleukin-1 receptor domain-containing protein [Geomonas sp. Red32]